MSNGMSSVTLTTTLTYLKYLRTWFILVFQRCINAIESYQNWLCSYSSLLLQRFKLKTYVSLHNDLFDKQHTPSPANSVSTIFRYLIFFHSSDSSRRFHMWGFLLPGIVLLRFLFRHRREILPLAGCHHQRVLYLDSELSLNLRAHCSAILVSRQLNLLLKMLLDVVHTVDFF